METNTDIVDTVFDSSNELLKQVVREIFNYSKSAIDGVCAATIHATQSQHFKGYYY